MPRTNGQQWAERWNSGMTSPQTATRIQEGIDRVQKAPGEMAAAASQKWITGIQEAHQTGRWQDKVRAVSLEDWKTKTKSKVATNLASGVAAVQNEMAGKGQRLMDAIGQVEQRVNAMPNNTFQERLARMQANATLLHEMKGRI